MFKKFAIAFIVPAALLLQGCYTLATVEYPTYDVLPNGQVPAQVLQTSAYINSVDGRDVTPSFLNKLGQKIVPFITLGRIDNKVLILPGKHRLDVGFYDSSSYTVPSGLYTTTTYTTTYTMSGKMECKLKSGAEYEMLGNYDQSRIALKEKGTSDALDCLAHR